MSDVSNNVSANSLYWSEQPVEETNNNQSLTQEDFFSMLSQQLSMQDPFEPVDNDQMISQMSSFATVDGINSLNSGIDNLNAVMASNQALEASGLVGQKVLIPSDVGYLNDPAEGITGVISVPTGASNTKVQVLDDAGQVVDTFELPDGSEGNVDFKWDGTNADGEAMPAGEYTFTTTASVNGASEALPSFTYAHVSSVTLGGATNPTVLNLKGLGGISLSEILAVAEA